MPQGFVVTLKPAVNASFHEFQDVSPAEAMTLTGTSEDTFSEHKHGRPLGKIIGGVADGREAAM